MTRDFIISSGAEYQDRFAREQSSQTRQAEWESRLPPLQTYWDRAWAGLLFAGVIAALAYLLVMR